MSRPIGTVAIVLHAHLPFVRHPEHEDFLEERWLYEAIVDTYLPLLEVFRNLAADRVPFQFTLSMSPPLCAMLKDDLLKLRTGRHLDQLLALGEKECRRLANDATFLPVARFYLEHFSRLKQLYDHLQGDIVEGFRQLQDAGHIEIITVGATHGYLPAIREPKARRAQIRVASDSYRTCFGVYPRGIWLPECGYTEGVEDLLADEGIRYFFVDSHGITCARPRPPWSTYAPVYTRRGVAAFGRDIESSLQVWSAEHGYPGDPVYRDFYRDIGFDLPLDYIGPFVHPDGIRIQTGFKYHRVTTRGTLEGKQPYDPQMAENLTAMHAGNFMFNREKQTEYLAAHMERPPIIVCPYDAELYGHWWFEGPRFLNHLARKIAGEQQVIRLGTPAGYLETHPTNVVADMTHSSWGEGGYSAVWVDETNGWIYPHVHHAEARMVELASKYVNEGDPVRVRALNQAARELLLAESSDWAFIMKTRTAVQYACQRVKAHLGRFSRLEREIEGRSIDEDWLRAVEGRDNLFPELDFRVYL